jgi:uncharacterized protein YjbI with pentapeptide repeats
MRTYTVFKTLVLVNLLVVTVFQADAHAGSESDKVKENIRILQKTKACPGCDLSGAELNRMDLSEANLQGANLTDAKLYLVNFSGANLQKAHLQRAHFGGADLTGADLRGADLLEADLNGAYLGGAKFDSEFVRSKTYEDEMSSESEEKTHINDLVQPHETASIQEDGKKVLNEQRTADEQKEEKPVVPPVQADEPIKNILVSDNLQPSSAAHDQTDPEIKEEPAQDSKKEMSGRAGSSTDRTRDEGVVKKDEATESTTSKTITPKEISGGKANNLKRLLDTKKCYQCDLSGIDLSDKNLGEADLEGANLTGSDLEKTDLGKAVLRGALLVGADLKKADLRGADLYRADLSGADLNEANMEGAKTDGAIFTGAIGR